MSETLNTATYVIQKENLVTHDSEEETLIYDLDQDKAFCLNQTSAIVWRFCNGKNSISDISKNLSKHFNIPVDENFVWFILEQLGKKNLIRNVPEMPAELGGLSRRDVIKRIGLGTMIALPVISSLIAPLATHAASGTNLAAGRPCTRSSQCSSSNTTTVTPTTSSNPAQRYTGSCCRNVSGNQPYGPGNTCVPGPSNGFVVVQGFIAYNGNTTNGGPVNCIAG